MTPSESKPPFSVSSTRPGAAGSPLYDRFGALFVACLLPVGVHYSQQLDGLKPFFSADARWEPRIDGVYWGLLQTTYTAPNLVIPLFAGVLVDRCARPAAVCLLFLTITWIGELLFACAAAGNLFSLLFVGRFLSGCGEGCISLMGSAILAHAFYTTSPTEDTAGVDVEDQGSPRHDENDRPAGADMNRRNSTSAAATSSRRYLALALGISELVHAVSNTMATSFAVPITQHFDGDYSVALFVAWGWCGFSLCVGVFAWVYQRKLGLDRPYLVESSGSDTHSVGEEVCDAKDLSPEAKSESGPKATPAPGQFLFMPATVSRQVSSDCPDAGHGQKIMAKNSPLGIMGSLRKPLLSESTMTTPTLPEAALLQHPTSLAARTLTRRPTDPALTVHHTLFYPEGASDAASTPGGAGPRHQNLHHDSLSYSQRSSSISHLPVPPPASTDQFSTQESASKLSSDVAAAPRSRLTGASAQEGRTSDMLVQHATTESTTATNDQEQPADLLRSVGREDHEESLSWWRQFYNGADGFWCVLLFHAAFCSSRRLFGHVDVDFFATQYGVPLTTAGYLAGLQSSGAVFMPILVGVLFLRIEEESETRSRISGDRVGDGFGSSAQTAAALQQGVGAHSEKSYTPNAAADAAAASISFSTGLSQRAAPSSTATMLLTVSETSASTLDQELRRSASLGPGGATKAAVVAAAAGSSLSNPSSSFAPAAKRLKRVSLLLLIACALAMGGSYLFFADALRPVQVPIFFLMLVSGIEPTVLKSLVPLTTVHLATAFGCFESLECLIKFVGGPMVGMLRDEVGNYSADLAIFAAILLTAAVFGCVYLLQLTLRERRMKEQDEDESETKAAPLVLESSEEAQAAARAF